jgi:hypothetical protein
MRQSRLFFIEALLFSGFTMPFKNIQHLTEQQKLIAVQVISEEPPCLRLVLCLSPYWLCSRLLFSFRHLPVTRAGLYQQAPRRLLDKAAGMVNA